MSDAILTLLADAKLLARRYRALTGKPLGKLCISNHHAAQFEKMTALSLS